MGKPQKQVTCECGNTLGWIRVPFDRTRMGAACFKCGGWAEAAEGIGGFLHEYGFFRLEGERVVRKDRICPE